ncbi:MAG: hypothetical protein H6739_18405 [Alphaproteobacteria bacterium]|nr:hypothetical protein [Alphaproteobacteria bacterium]
MNRSIAVISLWMLAACTDVENPKEGNEEEVITTVILEFTPAAGGSTVSAAWADIAQDGNPEVDGITLSDADDYTLSVRFLNEQEDPAEEITEEVEAESDVHQVFFTGTAVESDATGTNDGAVVTQTYNDADENGIPIGLDSDIVTVGPGAGTFVVTLRHLADEEDGTVLKTDGLAEDVASGGFDQIPGETDVQVTFDLDVQ